MGQSFVVYQERKRRADFDWFSGNIAQLASVSKVSNADGTQGSPFDSAHDKPYGKVSRRRIQNQRSGDVNSPGFFVSSFIIEQSRTCPVFD
jgi:hypothetical protein